MEEQSGLGKDEYFCDWCFDFEDGVDYQDVDGDKPEDNQEIYLD